MVGGSVINVKRIIFIFTNDRHPIDCRNILSETLINLGQVRHHGQLIRNPVNIGKFVRWNCRRYSKLVFQDVKGKLVVLEGVLLTQSVEVEEVWTVMVNDSAEGEATLETGRHVTHNDAVVSLNLKIKKIIKLIHLN